MSSVDFYKKARGAKDLFFLDFFSLFYQEKSEEAILHLNEIVSFLSRQKKEEKYNLPQKKQPGGCFFYSFKFDYAFFTFTAFKPLRPSSVSYTTTSFS